MALAIDQRVNSGTIATTPQPVAVTLAASSQLFVFIFGEGGETVSTVKWNTTESLTLIDTKRDSIASATYVYCYGLANPTSGTHNVDVVWSAAPSGGGFVAVISTTGGDTTTAWRTAQNRNDTTGTGPGLTLANSQNGDQVFHAANVIATTIVFDGSEVTTSTVDNDIAGSGFSAGVSTLAATGANTVVGCTDQSFYCEVAFAAIPASGGGITAAQEAGIWAAMQSSGVIGRVDA